MSGQGLRANPYVGLRPFFADDSLYFFGREPQTAELLEILRQHRFLGVVGSSGSGKSSLVRAGLLPALLGGFLVQDRDRWRTAQMKPGDAPIVNLAVELLEAMEQAPTPASVAELENEIREGHTDAVLEFLAPRLESNANLFLLVDQFEEIFAFRGIDPEDEAQSEDLARRKERARRKAEASDFVDLLLALAEQRKLPIYVALTMRTDFLGDCDLFYGLPEALNRGRYLVPRMTREQLRQAIECPALLPGAQIAPRLMDHLLNELGDRFDRLPVLQHALLRTWDEWQRGGGAGPIDLRHFEAAGGLEHALDQDAESALEGLDIGLTGRVFKRLTDTDLSQRRVRSPARISELVAAAGGDRQAVEAIVRRFEENGRSFVHPSADGKPDDPRVDISHESLIRQWDRLRNWVDEERRSRDQYKELVARARKKEQRKAKLLEDPELQMAIDWRAMVAPSSGWARRYASAEGDYELAAAYLDESVDVRCRNLAEAELQRRWKKIWNPLILLSVVLAAAFFTGERQGVGLQVHTGGTPAAPMVTVDVPAPAKPAAVAAVGTADPGAPIALEQARSSFTSGLERLKEVWYLGLFVLAYFGLTEAGKRIHRNVRYPVILQGIALSGGRGPAQDKADAAELQDAVVAHHTTYAGAMRRLGGFLIDWIYFMPFLLAGVVIVGVAGGFPEEGDPSDAATLSLFGLWLVFAWLYETLQIASSRQATWGMRAVGIFRTDLHGGRLSFARASVWYGYRVLSYLLYGLAFLPQLFTAKRQTLHDLLAGSVVLRRPQPLAVSPATTSN